MTNAPRVTIDDIEAQIAYEYYLRGDQFTRLYQANTETRHEPRGLCPKGCGALIYLGHAHMCSAQREV